MSLNEIIQWSSVIAILVIAVVTIVRKIVRFNRSIASDGAPCTGCHCGDAGKESRPDSTGINSRCDGCSADCALRLSSREQ